MSDELQIIAELSRRLLNDPDYETVLIPMLKTLMLDVQAHEELKQVVQKYMAKWDQT